MIKLFFCCHGTMASGMKKSLDILIGNTENLKVFDAYVNEEQVKDHVDAFFSSCEAKDMKVLMSDIYGGSVNQILYQYADRKNTILVTGINLPLLLEIVVAANNGILTEEIVTQYVEQAKDSIKVISIENVAESNDEFF
ncbi:PTS sugar transporter subunit IIA [Dielma fastidiosa]|uniref:PTS sugar transporter subunit IIA n=1 Tax=Dielma fastidiosa TaxID=1034346 RepID=UPI003561397A